jgi:hypothetical protein
MIVILICASTIIMALDSPLDDPNSAYKTGLLMTDNVITGVYAIECLLKIVS